jgi:hypothetical protein
MEKERKATRRMTLFSTRRVQTMKMRKQVVQMQIHRNTTPWQSMRHYSLCPAVFQSSLLMNSLKLHKR